VTAADGEPFDLRDLGPVADYLRGFDAAGGPQLSARIHPADEMFRFELTAPHRTRAAAAILYLAAGRQIFQAVEQIVGWRFRGWSGVGSLLDFASGYGRSTRFLVRALAPEKVTVTEIDPGAVRFQEEAFGVRGVVSGTEPDDRRLGGPFDVVLASSFFSHLPAARFEAWMAQLHALVVPGGVLIFSVHGMGLLPPGLAAPPSGIAFQPVSETLRLAGAEYGTSYVTPELVRGVTERVAGSGARLLAFPFGLCGFQDLYALCRPPVPEGPDPRLALVPRGVFEHGAVENGLVTAQGWAVGDRDERPPDMRLVIGDRVAEISPGEGAAGARRSWRFAFPVAGTDPDALVRVEAVSPRGVTRILVAETLRPYLPGLPRGS
jgi:SAM-dependent methyltransferase